MSVWLLMVEPQCGHNRLGNLTILVTKTSQHSPKLFVQATSVRDHRLLSLSVSLLQDMRSNTPFRSPPGRRQCTSALGRLIPTPATRLSFRPGPLAAASSVRFYTTASPYSPTLTTLSPLTRRTLKQRSRHGRGRLSPCICLEIPATWMHCGRLHNVTGFS